MTKNTTGSGSAANVAAQPSLRSWFGRLLPRGLSGKLLVITTIFIMLVEVFVFIPTIANFRLTWIERHFTTGEAAGLALMQMDGDDGTDALRQDLLDLTHAEMIGMRHGGASIVLAAREMPKQVERQISLTTRSSMDTWSLIRDALDTLVFGGDRAIRIFGTMKTRPDASLEMVIRESPLRNEMLVYARNTLYISLGISLATALLVFLTLRWLLIRPLQRISKRMLGFAKDPQDANQIIVPSGRRDEIGVTEEQLSEMQQQVRGTITQQKRLADLGLAVSKINHDLRNILASASLFSDRLSGIEDPTVKRIAPRLVRSLDRAVDYAQSVITYGKAGEAVPQRRVLRLNHLMEEVAQVLALDLTNEVEWINNVPPALEIEADTDQLFRVLHNLCRNAVEAMTDPVRTNGTTVHRLTVSATKESGQVTIKLSDTGPGFPQEARETMFDAFHASSRSAGTGLGLSIAADLVHGHGGTIRLLDGAGPGAYFEIKLPQANGGNGRRKGGNGN